MPETGNIMQRLFDAFPPYPYTVTAHTLRIAFPYYDALTLELAVKRLRRGRFIEIAPGGTRGVYRRVKGSFPPMDRRGHGKGGRKRKVRT